MTIILFVLFLLISLLCYFPQNDKFFKLFNFITVGLLLIIIAGLRGEGVDRDYDMYILYFTEQDYLLVEPAFVIISKIIYFVFGYKIVILFLTFATLGITLKFTAIKQITDLWFLSICIYVSNFFILHEMTQIRAGIASAFLLLCIKPIYERNWKRFLLFSILGFLFHYSAIVILPLWFLGVKSRKHILFFSLPIAYLIYFSGINLITTIPIPVIQSKISMYQTLMELGDEGSILINVFNLVFLAKIIIFYFLLFKYEIILEYNKYAPILMKIFCISLISYPVLAVMPPIATRISELFSVIEILLIPLIFYVFKPCWFSRSIVIFIGMCFLLINLLYTKLIIS